MTWAKLIAGLVVGLLGIVWLAQGVGLIRGSFMSGQAMWAIIGAVLIVLAAWLLWSTFRSRSINV
jgi:hypothetical protein